MKRLTDTEKWRDPWFRKLTPGMKLAFLFIVDNCDAAGVWDADKELADFSIGQAVPWEKVQAAMGDRVEVLPNGRWHLTRFVKFHYGSLSDACRAHKPVLAALASHGLDRDSDGYPKGGDTLSNRVKPNGAKSSQPHSKTQRAPRIPVGDQGPLFTEFWEAYPRKRNRGDAESAWQKHGADRIAEKIMTALARMKASPDWKKDRGEFIPYPASWLNAKGWEDEPQATVSAIKSPKHEDPDGWREFLVEHERPYEPHANAMQLFQAKFERWKEGR